MNDKLKLIYLVGCALNRCLNSLIDQTGFEDEEQLIREISQKIKCEEEDIYYAKELTSPDNKNYKLIEPFIIEYIQKPFDCNSTVNSILKQLDKSTFDSQDIDGEFIRKLSILGETKYRDEMIELKDLREKISPYSTKDKKAKAKAAAKGRLGKGFGKLGKGFGELGGNTNNPVNEERRFAAAQACEACKQCGRLLPRTQFWAGDWLHHTWRKIACKGCCPTMPSDRKKDPETGRRKRSAEAAAKPITCKVCKKSQPRSEFRPSIDRKYHIYKGLTCETCRANGKLDKGGRKTCRPSA